MPSNRIIEIDPLSLLLRRGETESFRIKLHSDEFNEFAMVYLNDPNNFFGLSKTRFRFNKNNWNRWQTVNVTGQTEGEYRLQLTSKRYGNASLWATFCTIPPRNATRILLPEAELDIPDTFVERTGTNRARIRLKSPPSSIGLRDCTVIVNPYYDGLFFNNRNWSFNNRNWNEWQSFRIVARRNETFVDNTYDLEFETGLRTIPENAYLYENSVVRKRITVFNTNEFDVKIEWMDTSDEGNPNDEIIDMIEGGTQPIMVIVDKKGSTAPVLLTLEVDNVDVVAIEDPNDSTKKVKSINLNF